MITMSPFHSPSAGTIGPPCTMNRPPYGARVASIFSMYSMISDPKSRSWISAMA